MSAVTGVLVMAYGAAQGPEDLLRYYTHIRHGSVPTEEQLQDLRFRYDAIGGQSPLADITERQAAGLQKALDSAQPGAYRVFLGMKHSTPFIAEAVDAIAASGLDHFVAIVLAPHFSSMSVGDYFNEIEGAMQNKTPSLHWVGVQSWHLDPGLIQLLATRIEQSQALFSLSERESLVTVFSAHSLPQRILQMGDPYPEQLRQTGEMVADRVGLTRYLYSWQSAGRTREPWMGPDILDTVRALHAEGSRSVLVCPAGFVSDHLEILYDLDIQCQELCGQLGMHMERTASFNDAPDFLEVLASIVMSHSPSAGSL